MSHRTLLGFPQTSSCDSRRKVTKKLCMGELPIRLFQYSYFFVTPTRHISAPLGFRRVIHCARNAVASLTVHMLHYLLLSSSRSGTSIPSNPVFSPIVLFAGCLPRLYSGCRSRRATLFAQLSCIFTNYQMMVGIKRKTSFGKQDDTIRLFVSKAK